ncbi:MAG: beta-propeller domain-containing protein [Clostridia bacterium]|nr:beta-propeller domain-containing protein [Clostridia bacterium]
MFEEKYRKDNENIVLDEAAKRYIKAKITDTPKANLKINYNAIIAAALSLVLALGVIFVAGKTAPVFDYVGETSLMHNLTYDTIYDSINERRKSDNNFFSEITDGIAYLTGSLAKGDATAPESATDSATGTDQANKGNSSTTNNQVQGVDEADLVKNDGRYIYSVKDGSILITDSNNGQPKLIAKKDVTNDGETIGGLFVNGDRLAVLLENYRYSHSGAKVRIVVFNISDKENITVLKETTQNGYFSNARMIGDTVYLLSNYAVPNNISKNKVETFVPCVDNTAIAESNIYVINEFESLDYLVVSSISLQNGEVIDSTAVLGGAQNVYCNNEHLYYTFSKYGEYGQGEKTEYRTETTIVKLSLKKDKIETVATGKVQGRPLNQFSMDEYGGNLRIVTTVDVTTATKTNYTSTATTTSANALYVLDSNLKQIGAIEDIAEGERVYSVRFSGEIGYFVTFRQVDPLFTVDLKDPTKPKILSELKIPGFSEYMHPFGEGKLFGFGKAATELGAVTSLKISMFDVSDPTNVTENHVTEVDSLWSEASSNHKAIMVDTNKNIIAFLGTDNLSRTNLYVYGYDEQNGFFIKAVEFVDNSYNFGTRFVWINDHFYLVTQNGITVFDLRSFEKLSRLAF